MDGSGAPGERGLVGHVGRRGLTFALTDGAGGFDPDTLHFHEASSSTSISGAIAAFLRAQGLAGAKLRAAIAIAGLVRGDSISVTHTRWWVSRSGLSAMLGHAPILLNDFEAEAWALAGRGDAVPGTHVIAGMTSGMGVSVLRREAGGGATVLASEAGHLAFAPPTDALAELTDALFPGRRAIPAEALASAPGLLAAYRHLAGKAARHDSPEAITEAQDGDAVAHRACRLIAAAFAAHVGNLVLAFGAWEGVVAVGGLAMALRQHFETEEVRAAFAGEGKYARLLADVPWRTEHVRHGELSGAAAALAATAADPVEAAPCPAPPPPPRAAFTRTLRPI